MTTNATTPRLLTPRTAFVGLWAATALCYVALLLAGRPVAAAVAFGVGALVATAYQSVGAVPLDERDAAVYEVASARTLQAVGVASAVVFPALTLAWGAGAFRWTPFAAGVGATVAALFALWLTTVIAVRARR